jgi:hypothetical protein
MLPWSPRLFTALLAPVLYVSFAAADGYSRNPGLVGHWAHKGPEIASVLIISENGTWSGTVSLAGQPDAQFEGKWLTDKHYVYWLYTKSSSVTVKVGARDKDKLVEITKDFFVLDTRDNRRVKYVRIK